MRRDTIEVLGAVNRWIDLAKGSLAKQVQLSLQCGCSWGCCLSLFSSPG
jgi:hypothetical protein